MRYSRDLDPEAVTTIDIAIDAVATEPERKFLQPRPVPGNLRRAGCKLRTDGACIGKRHCDLHSGPLRRLGFRAVTFYDPAPACPSDAVPATARAVRDEQISRCFYCLSFRAPG